MEVTAQQGDAKVVWGARPTAKRHGAGWASKKLTGTGAGWWRTPKVHVVDITTPNHLHVDVALVAKRSPDLSPQCLVPWTRCTGRKRDTGSPGRFDHDAFGQGCGRFRAATRCMSAEAGSIRSGPLLAAAPGRAATASDSARFGERQARLGLIRSMNWPTRRYFCSSACSASLIFPRLFASSNWRMRSQAWLLN
jgi:hypothetical protein